MVGTLVRMIALAGSILTAAAQAAGIASVSPQGEVAQVRQIVVRFDAGVVPLGDLRQPDPMALACQGAAPAGSGRWDNDRIWVFDFREPLPPGTRCTLKARADWKPAQGALTGKTDFAFSTGGPAVVRIEPYEGSTVEEDQHFLLHLSGPVVNTSVAGHAWCEAEGIGERIGTRVVTGAPRDDLIKARKNTGADLTEAFARWSAMPDIHTLLRGGAEQIAFLVLEEEEDPLRDRLQAALAVADRWERREALRALAGEVQQRTVSVYARRSFHPEDYAEPLGPFWILRPGYYRSESGLDLRLDEEDPATCIF